MKFTISVSLLTYVIYFLYLLSGGTKTIPALNQANGIYFNTMLGFYITSLIVYGSIYLYAMSTKRDSMMIKMATIVFFELLLGIPALLLARQVTDDVTPDNYRSLFFVGASTVVVLVKNSLNNTIVKADE